MSKIYVTSDLHFCHNKEFLYEPRGFKNIYEHDKTIVNNWNQKVDDDDLVIVLGDIMLKNNESGCYYFNQLKGNKIIILGNHDTDARQEFYPNLRGVLSIKYADMFKYGGYNFFLSHYPSITSEHTYTKPLSHRIINLCGHTHIADKFADWDKGYIYHCELDAHNNYPIDIEDIIRDLEEKVNE